MAYAESPADNWSNAITLAKASSVTCRLGRVLVESVPDAVTMPGDDDGDELTVGQSKEFAAGTIVRHRAANRQTGAVNIMAIEP